MDIVTHAVLSAAMAVAAAPRRDVRVAAVIGGVAGVLADVDALVHSTSDPLLFLELHRHFTHALLFVPLGALAAAVLLWLPLRRRLSFLRIYQFAFLGYCLAGLLDACTSYGTHLSWPFSEARTAWSIIAVFDPVFTLLLGVPLLTALLRGRSGVARVGLGLAACYLAFGVIQHERAERTAMAIAQGRGHVVERMLVKPTMANLVLWRVVYVHAGQVQVDGLHLGLAGRHYPGSAVPLLVRGAPIDGVPAASLAAREIRRFIGFADDMAVRDASRPNFVGDVRYAMLPTSVEPLWGITFEPGSGDGGVQFVTNRNLSPTVRGQFIDMLLGRDVR